MSNDDNADMRRAFDEARAGHPRRHEEFMAEVRAYLRNAIAADEVSSIVGVDDEDDVQRIFTRARSILLRAVQERGLLSWLTFPLLGAVSFIRQRLAARRDMAVLTSSAVGVVQQASVLVVAVAIGGIFVSPVMASATASSDPARAIRSAAAGSVQPTSLRARAPERVTEPTASLPAIVSGVETERVKTKTRVYRDERYIYVGRSISTWTPTASVENERIARWRCDPESRISETACDSYDQVPEGPWAP